jgi:hypothetical protein
MRLSLAIMLVASLAGVASAQHIGAGPRGGFGFRHGFGQNFGGRHSLYDSAFGYPFFSDAFYDQGYPSSSQPIVVMQPTSAVANPEPVREPAQPLLIELQGDRYVRVAGDGGNSGENPGMIGPTGWNSNGTNASVHASKLDPVVLVFRDGHREEVSDYTIANGVLYSRADYYSGGAWNKQIRLAGLNVGETMATNQARGVAFRLPASPNEVITRP